MTEALDRLARETMEDWAFRTVAIKAKVYGSDLEKLVARIAKALRESKARGLERAASLIEQNAYGDAAVMNTFARCFRSEANEIRETIGLPMSADQPSAESGKITP